jgi:hypothetical protein
MALRITSNFLIQATKGLPENKIPNKKIEKCFFEKVIIFV